MINRRENNKPDQSSKHTTLKDLVQEGRDIISKKYSSAGVIQDDNATTILSSFSDKSAIQEKHIKPLIRYAIKNKVGLAFLDFTLKNIRNLRIYSKLKEQRSKFLSTLADVSKTLKREDISYSVFKTLKPIPCTPVDIDLLLSSEKDLRRTVTILENVYGGELMKRDRWTAGVHLSEKKEIVEPHLKLHVSGWVYLRKSPLLNSAQRMEVQGEQIVTLRPEAEILAIIAHSLFKEQLVTLNDVLTVICFLEISDWKFLQNLLSNVNMALAFRKFLQLVKKIENYPHRVSFFQLGALLTKKMINDVEARSTFPLFLTDLLTEKGMKSLVSHLRRETYIRGFR